jgi:transposase-like protein
MTPEYSVQLIEQIGKLLKEGNQDFLRDAVEKLYHILMELEVEEQINASRYERTESRITSRNGSRKRPLETTAGKIELNIPKLRKGNYMPSFIEPRRMTDKALVAIIQDAYINGVSTRKVDNLVESLGLNIDKSKVSRLSKELDVIVQEFRNRDLSDKEYPYLYLDATFPKVRENGHIRSMAMVIAVGINTNGTREVLGYDIGMSETGEYWTSFLQSLVNRGLRGVKLVISDSHQGLKAAISKVLTGSSWQRCQVHFMRNVLCDVPKKQKSLVAAIVRTIFMQEDIDSAKDTLKAVLEQLKVRFPKAAQTVLDAEEDVLAYMKFPEKHWKHIYSSNLIERLNKEIRRRFNVVSVFPDRDSVVRLGGAILIEQNDEWSVAERRYLSRESMDELMLKDAFKKLPDKDSILKNGSV